ncbi:thioredoxin family protein (plasmid) [Alkalihalobacillus hwajinpoensis]|uniref:thioredoxin family protein n=1 Tax=Guptibacillus hwajinpoensis TaxID=208199 RepID=UPI0018831DC5|nr:thioredoxin family protein [Pseudalkalibacillus hwajinpoensis]MBF0706571.1 thioredoxin family protein [Pseudalkalibacillus hwajinpoensis]
MGKRNVEVFIAGCPMCDETVTLVKELSCDQCSISYYNLNETSKEKAGLEKAKEYGITRVPAVVVDGKLLDCCQQQQRITREVLEKAGIGQG